MRSRSPTSMSALDRNPQVPALTPHKVLFPGIDERGLELPDVQLYLEKAEEPEIKLPASFGS